MLLFCCSYIIAAEQKARAVYDNILKLSDDPDVNDVIKFLRQREITHFQRFGEANHTDLRKILKGYRKFSVRQPLILYATLIYRVLLFEHLTPVNPL